MKAFHCFRWQVRGSFLIFWMITPPGTIWSGQWLYPQKRGEISIFEIGSLLWGLGTLDYVHFRLFLLTVLGKSVPLLPTSCNHKEFSGLKRSQAPFNWREDADNGVTSTMRVLFFLVTFVSLSIQFEGYPPLLGYCRNEIQITVPVVTSPPSSLPVPLPSAETSPPPATIPACWGHPMRLPVTCRLPAVICTMS